VNGEGVTSHGDRASVQRILRESPHGDRANEQCIEREFPYSETASGWRVFRVADNGEGMTMDEAQLDCNCETL
jgi:hypothetical protein